MISQCRASRSDRLELSGLVLPELPESIRELSHLEVLVVEDVGLRALPDWLFDMTHLAVLSVARTGLRTLPEAIGRLTGLRILALNDNLLTALPESIGDLGRLQELDVAFNQLERLPDSLSRLTSLASLKATGNTLETLPPDLDGLTSLRSLRLGRNRLSALPEDIGRLGHLVFLSVHANRLTGLPHSFRHLTDLHSLLIWDNPLCSVPPQIAELTTLTNLDLTHCGLTEVPGWLGHLPQLINLILDQNRLTELPVSLGHLRRSARLGLAGNPLTTPPPEIVAAGTPAVLSFLRDLDADAVRQWSSKVVVVGEGRVGKTSLLKALRGEDHDPHEDSTHGLTVGRLALPHPSPPDPDRPVTMRLATWDFGGQEIYHATHQFFLTDRSLFLLLWAAQIGWEASKLHYWLDMIKARAPHAPVLLVATHLGPRPPDLPLSALRETYPGLIIGSMSADSASGQGVDEVRERVRQEVARLPLMGATWPRTWLRAADAVRAHPEKHISPEQLNDLLAGAGVRDASHQDSLAAALHSLGDLLSYPDDEELCDLVVLRPQWLTGYISRVLDSEEVLREGGLFRHAYGHTLWQDVDRSLRRHFVRMMENFDLSYRTVDKTASLVVELLPWEPPEYTAEWDRYGGGPGQRELRLRYRLHTVPPGIPTWFIAREHRFSTPVRWRSGALLKHADGEHAALITVDRHAKSAELRVRGPYPQDFFAVLKDGFEQTLLRYPGLDITRLVPCPHHDDAGRPCTHEFRHEQLVHRLTMNPPRERIECPEHLWDVDVPFLLQGIERPGDRESHRMLSDLVARVDSLQRADRTQHAELTAMLAEQQRGFLHSLRREQSRQEVLCPSLVWVRRLTRREAGHALLPGEVFQLHLCCEAPGEWHLLEGVEPYELPAHGAFTETVLPYVHRTLQALKFVVPVFGASLGAVSEELGKAMKDDVDVLKALLDGLPEELRRGLGESGSRSTVHAVDHAEHRRMHALLRELDPAEEWGGLNKVTTPEGPTYWLCKAHARTYEQGSRAVPAPAVPVPLPRGAQEPESGRPSTGPTGTTRTTGTTRHTAG
ncbi:COR domain-containing protein [Streptomyces sp. NPDC005955]|uniref:COR domain-containing protein n=1 Tax=Streptomyces sp. NPDC005955 TaxID=3364738 RepID=UPI0036B5E868